MIFKKQGNEQSTANISLIFQTLKEIASNIAAS